VQDLNIAKHDYKNVGLAAIKQYEPNTRVKALAYFDHMFKSLI
jgi:hypothetical protein